MTIVSEYDFESDTWTHNSDTPARQAFRQAVADIAAKAKETLPECNGRVDKAVAMVLNGDVELLADGKAKVASQSNGTTQYFVVNGTCECRDFAKAPSGWCKHRIAAGLAKRVAARVRSPLDAPVHGQVPAPSQPTPAPAGSSTPLPEAPASVNVYLELGGRQVQLTLRDTDEGRLLERLAAVLERFPVPAAPTTTAPAVDEAARCRTHGVVMKLNHGKDGRTWHSHKTVDGWCKGK